MPGGTRKKAAPKDGLAASQRSLGRESSGGVNDVPGESAEAAQLLVLDELRATHAVVAFGGEGEKGRPLVGYVVHIRVADHRSGGENLCSWRVCRRYREFLKLRNAVQTAMEGAKPTKPAPNGKQPPGRRSGRVKIPRFPSHHLLKRTNKSKALIEQRLKQLNAWLTAVAQLAECLPGVLRKTLMFFRESESDVSISLKCGESPAGSPARHIHSTYAAPPFISPSRLIVVKLPWGIVDPERNIMEIISSKSAVAGHDRKKAYCALTQWLATQGDRIPTSRQVMMFLKSIRFTFPAADRCLNETMPTLQETGHRTRRTTSHASSYTQCVAPCEPMEITMRDGGVFQISLDPAPDVAAPFVKPGPLDFTRVDSLADSVGNSLSGDRLATPPSTPPPRCDSMPEASAFLFDVSDQHEGFLPPDELEPDTPVKTHD